MPPATSRGRERRRRRERGSKEEGGRAGGRELDFRGRKGGERTREARRWRWRENRRRERKAGCQGRGREEGWREIKERGGGKRRRWRAVFDMLCYIKRTIVPGDQTAV